MGDIILKYIIALLVHTFDDAYRDTGIGDQFGPLWYARLLLAAWIVLTAIALAQAAMSPRPPPESGRNWGTALAVIAACGALVAVSLAAGFLAGSIAFFLACALSLGYRRPVPLLLAGAGVPGAIWYLFYHVIQIRLPTGAWALGFLNGAVTTPASLVAILAGTFAGIVIGALPGLGSVSP